MNWTLALAQFSITFTASVLLFPLIYPWWVAALILIGYALGLVYINGHTRDQITWRDLPFALGILAAGGWVYLLRECTSPLLHTFCSIR